MKLFRQSTVARFLNVRLFCRELCVFRRFILFRCLGLLVAQWAVQLSKRSCVHNGPQKPACRRRPSHVKKFDVSKATRLSLSSRKRREQPPQLIADIVLDQRCARKLCVIRQSVHSTTGSAQMLTKASQRWAVLKKKGWC